MATVAEPRVLLVEDDPDVQLCVKTILTIRGFEVATAADGAEALAWLRSSGQPKPNLILLDLMMPGMNGFEFRSHMIADPDLSDIPVVVITGAGTLTEQENALLKTEVLRKPLDLPDLLETVDRFCSNASQATFDD